MFYQDDPEELLSLEREMLSARRLIEGTAHEMGQPQYAEARQVARRLVSEIIYPTGESGHGYAIHLQEAIVRCHKNVICIALTEMLDDPDEIIGLGAALALFEFDGIRDPQVQRVVASLRSDDESIRFRAAMRVSVFDSLPPDITRELKRLMSGPDGPTRVAAAAGLCHLPASFRILQKAFYGDESLKLMAANALAKSGRLAGDAMHKMLTMLEQSAEIRYAVICVLLSSKIRPPEAEPILQRLLRDFESEPRLRHAALQLLLEIQSDDPLRATLMDAFHTNDIEAKLIAVRYLEKAGDVVEDAIRLLGADLASPKLEERSAAVMALREIGPAAASVVPRLLDLLLTPKNKRIHQLLADTIVTIGIESWLDQVGFTGRAIATLIAKARKSRSLEELRRLAAILAMFREAALPALLEMVRAKDLDVRIAVAALIHMGEVAATVVTDRLLTDDDIEIREVAMTILSYMGPAARPAIPRLIGLLADGPMEIRPDLLRTITALGPEAKDAVPALVDILLERDAILSAWAETALLSIGAIAAELFREAYARLGGEDASRLLAVMDKLGIATSKAAGLEVVRDEALLIKKQLVTFHAIGLACKDRGTDRFVIAEFEKPLNYSGSAIKIHLDDVSSFFRRYFARFEGISNLADDQSKADKSHKIFDRFQGKKASICHPLGWKAWELTSRFLGNYTRIQQRRKS